MPETKIRIACEGAATLPLDAFEFFQGDLKKLTPKNAERLRKEILQDGFSEPVAVWRKGEHNWILNGHQRIAVLRSMADEFEIPPLPVSWVEAKTYKEAKHKLLGLTSQYGEMTFDGLAAFSKDLDLSFDDLDTTFRFPEVDLSAFREMEDDSEAVAEMIDRAEALLEKWGVERGQIWEISGKAGTHRVMCGDSTDDGDVALLLGDAEPYLMVTDPPYGVEYDPTWRDEAGGQFGDGRTVQRGKVLNDDRSDWSEVFRNWPSAVLYSWSPGGDHIIATGKAILDAGFQIRGQIIWRKSHFVLSRGAYHWQHEPCWYGVRSGSKAKWVGDRKQSTVWDLAGMNPAGGCGEKKTGHGTQKPVECMARPIRNHEGNVADPFLGSGTTVVAAEQEGRICYGMEIEPKYAAVTLERLAALELEPKQVTDVRL